LKQIDSDLSRSIYLRIMESISRKHYAQWVADAKKDSSPKSIMMTSRALNMETSLSVFCGQHIPPKAIAEISEKYWLITKALQLVNFPLNVPGTNVYNACKARKIAMKWLEAAAASCKEYIKNGGEVECMLDAWVVEINAAKEKTGRDFSDREMAMVIFSFLFASQDAMSSGIIFLFQHLADRPEMLAKVREEQLRVRGDANTPMTLEMLDEMVYLKAFVKESLRLIPPVTMVMISSFSSSTIRELTFSLGSI
jgi:C-22 sterol desaturase